MKIIFPLSFVSFAVQLIEGKVFSKSSRMKNKSHQNQQIIELWKENVERNSISYINENGDISNLPSGMLNCTAQESLQIENDFENSVIESNCIIMTDITSDHYLDQIGIVKKAPSYNNQKCPANFKRIPTFINRLVQKTILKNNIAMIDSAFIFLEEEKYLNKNGKIDSSTASDQDECLYLCTHFDLFPQSVPEFRIRRTATIDIPFNRTNIKNQSNPYKSIFDALSSKKYRSFVDKKNCFLLGSNLYMKISINLLESNDNLKMKLLAIHKYLVHTLISGKVSLFLAEIYSTRLMVANFVVNRCRIISFYDELFGECMLKINSDTNTIYLHIANNEIKIVESYTKSIHYDSSRQWLEVGSLKIPVRLFIPYFEKRVGF